MLWIMTVNFSARLWEGFREFFLGDGGEGTVPERENRKISPTQYEVEEQFYYQHTDYEALREAPWLYELSYGRRF